MILASANQQFRAVFLSVSTDSAIKSMILSTILSGIVQILCNQILNLVHIVKFIKEKITRDLFGILLRWDIGLQPPHMYTQKRRFNHDYITFA